jgi:flagellar motor switch protein FliG
VETSDLALALKGVGEELRAKFFKNMSSRAGEMLQEEMEYMGPVRLRDVEDAQQKIVDRIRALEEAGEIVLGGGGEDIVI